MNLALAPDVHRFLASAAALLRATADPDKLLAHYVRGARELFGADQACVAVAERGTGTMRLRHATPRDRRWNEPALTRALAEPGATTPKGLMAAALDRRGRRWGVLAIARSGGAFQRGTGHALGLLPRICRTSSAASTGIGCSRCGGASIARSSAICRPRTCTTRSSTVSTP